MFANNLQDYRNFCDLRSMSFGDSEFLNKSVFYLTLHTYQASDSRKVIRAVCHAFNSHIQNFTKLPTDQSRVAAEHIFIKEIGSYQNIHGHYELEIV